MGDLSFPQADLLTTQGRMQHLQKKEQKSVQTKPSDVDDSWSTHFIRLLAYLYSPCALFSRPLGGKSFIGRDAASGATGLCKVANLLFLAVPNCQYRPRMAKGVVIQAAPMHCNQIKKMGFRGTSQRAGGILLLI